MKKYPISIILLSSLCTALLGCQNGKKTDDTDGPMGGGGSSSLGGQPSTGGEGGALEAPECPEGLALVTTDYVSSEIALLSLTGEVRDASFLSTGSTATDGLAFPLSGDVAVPMDLHRELVILDRFGTNVLSFVDPKTAEVRAQLPVATGFESNPQDYLELGETEAALTRYGQNATPGEEAFDDGGDLLFLDTQKPEITGSVVFEQFDELPPRPTRISRVGEMLYITLERLSLDYATMGEAMLVPVSLRDRKPREPLVLEGLKSCGGLVTVPGKQELVAACSGFLTSAGEIESLSQSALVFFDATATPLTEIRRIPAEQIAGEPLQSELVFASESWILLKTQTAWGGDTNNRLLAYNLASGETKELLEAAPDMMGKGLGVALGSLFCAPGCSDVCLVPDKSRNEVARFRFASGSFRALSAVELSDGAGLPPSSFGSY